MNLHTEGCFICGKPLVYFEVQKKLPCKICGMESLTNASCEDGHFICDSCHALGGLTAITKYVLKTASKNPIEMATELMGFPVINMHGPEHHFLIPAVLLTAYKNAGGKIDLEKALQSAEQRAKSVPGGICGMWGCCGAGIGAGIFVSIITGATPLSQKEWSLANQATSECLAVIAENGGPRCCKRNTYLAITQSVIFTQKQFNIFMEMPENYICEFSHRNKQCRHKDCLYFATA